MADPRPTAASPQSAAEAAPPLLLEIVDHLDAMLAYWNTARLCEFANAAYADWFGKSRAQIIGRSMAELLGPLYAANLSYIDAAFAGRKQVFERDIPQPGGGLRPSLATYTPHVVDGQVRGIFVHVADVTPLKAMERELRAAMALAEHAAAHDPLTGLPNRRLLPETLERAIAGARRSGESLALLTIDVDHFKAINDAHGHAGGDATLVELAARLRRVLRACDVVFRVGGDEFVALLPSLASPRDVRGLASRIVHACRTPLRLATGVVRPTVTIGVASLSDALATPQALLAASDRTLYRAKHRGRDRFMEAR